MRINNLILALIAVSSARTAAALEEAPSSAEQAAPAPAPAKPGSQLKNVFRLLEEEANLKSAVATKVEQRSVDAPAIIEVITANQLVAAGYTSVAEALNRVPGLAVNTDYVSDNVGVRGISGGLRGGARHIKVLIDGQPVAFRPDAQNFLGQELIPMSVIDRIEVLRGPASALYGLNAFLGVVNIVTKRAHRSGSEEAVSEYSITARGEQMIENFGGAAEVLAMDEFGDFSFTLAAHMNYDDRSGLTLPSNGPNYSDFDPDAESKQDLSRPISAFGSFGYDAGSIGKFTLTSSYQRKDAHAAFADYGTFSNRTRVNLHNWFARLRHEIGIDLVNVTSYAAYSGGGPLGNDVIQPSIAGAPLSYRVTRDFGYRAIDVGSEAAINLLESSVLLAGVEYVHDAEQIRSNTYISNSTGAKLEGANPKTEPFTNFAGYAQALYRDLGWLQLSGNIRYDKNNQFGSNVNYRAGVVLAPHDDVRIKLLSGSSYRGPTPEQLYGTSVAPGDVQGSLAALVPETLKPQTAITHEAAVNHELLVDNTTLRTQLSGYYMEVKDRIEFLREGGQFRPANTAESQTFGGEFSATFLQNRIADFMSLSISASVSFQDTELKLDETLLTEREVERLKINELYPDWMYKAQVLAQIPTWYVRLHSQVTAYSERLQSQVNQTYGRPFVGSPIYTLPASYPIDVAISTMGFSLFNMGASDDGRRETMLELAVKDVLNTESEQPGFNGTNLPPLGRRFLVVLTQEL